MEDPKNELEFDSIQEGLEYIQMLEEKLKQHQKEKVMLGTILNEEISNKIELTERVKRHWSENRRRIIFSNNMNN